MFNLVSISKFQRTRLTFDLSAKVAYIGVPSTYLNIVFSETTWPIEIKIHMTIAYDLLAKIYTNCYGHMTKMATTPIYGKNSLNFFSGTKRPLALGLGMWHKGCGPYQVCTNDESRLTLTYFMARSNLVPNAFIWGNLKMFIFLQLFKAA